MSQRLPCAEVVIDIPFHDVDVLHVAWHGHYLKYFEVARCQLLRQIGYDYPQMKASGYAWPVSECYLKYVKPARYGQQVTVAAQIAEYENRLSIHYQIRDTASGVKLTQGYTRQVAVALDSGELQFVTPAALRRALGVAVD